MSSMRMGVGMRKYGIGVLLKVYFFSVFWGGDLGGETLVISDFDNTILETRTAFRGTFQPMVTLFRVEYRSNLVEPAAEGPREVEVPVGILNDLLHLLAKGPNQIGSLVNELELGDGQAVKAGHYELRVPESFRNFYHLSKEEVGFNVLLESFKQAEAADGAAQWKGLFWAGMVKSLSSADSAKRFVLMSSRAHSRSDWMEFFEYLQSRAYIVHLPSESNIHPLGRREYDALDHRANPANQKAQLVEKYARALEATPLRSGETSHTLVVAEDGAEALNAIYKQLARLVTRRAGAPLKVILVNTGYDWEVRESGRPRVSVITESGGVREPSQEELRKGLVQIDRGRLRSCRNQISQLPRP